jgi:hypothetical protein
MVYIATSPTFTLDTELFELMNGKTSSVFQRLLAATLLVSGMTALAAPAFADGTAAGTSIDNTATATYDNPDDPLNPFNATSNTVKVTVTEVAGVTVTGLSTIDVNGGVVAPNDIVNYEFKVTNVGNDTTEFFIPSTTVVSANATAGAVQITGYIKPDGTRVNFTAIPVTAGANTGTFTTLPVFPNPAGGNFPAGVIPAGYSLVLTVPVTIGNLASAGSPVTVQIGDTGVNDNGAGTQNQLDITDGKGTNEIRTVDYTAETNGAVADEKEAAATQQVIVGSQSQALATILKTRTSYDPILTTTLSDDVIGYGLSLKVESTAPVGSSNVTPGKLVGTDISVNSGAGALTVNRVLISDVVPANTDLRNLAGDIVAPADWTVVYTTTALTTPATNAAWTTTFDATATRIGFIYNATAVAPGKGPIAEGTSITGFGFKVVTNGITGTTPVNIFNIAQVFGQTSGNVGPDAPLVYDESGDKDPNNFNTGVSGNPLTLKPNSTAIPNGEPNPTNDGVDNNNDNTGQGPNGEDNVTTIALAGSILNGPNGAPGAVGPTDNNSDFTNRSTAIPAGTVPNVVGGIDPLATTFTNSVQNPGTTPLTNVLLVPDSSAFVAGAGEVLPPNGTTVTITYGTQTAIYTFNTTVGNFVFTPGPGSAAIVIPTLAAGQVVNYDVVVDLPAGTPLSTDTEKGFSIPIYAFKDVNGDSRPGTLIAEPTQNRTINRVYTGFLQLKKKARILESNGSTVVQGFTDVSTDLTGKGAAGRIIEYLIEYKNISIAPAGNGNATLDAKNVTISEDGVNGGNTWAKDTDANGKIDTSHKLNSVVVTYGGPTSVIFSPSGEQTGTTAATDVTKYVHKPGVIIQPQDKGSFTFRRTIN